MPNAEDPTPITFVKSSDNENVVDEQISMEHAITIEGSPAPERMRLNMESAKVTV